MNKKGADKMKTKEADRTIKSKRKSQWGWKKINLSLLSGDLSARQPHFFIYKGGRYGK